MSLFKTWIICHCITTVGTADLWLTRTSSVRRLHKTLSILEIWSLQMTTFTWEEEEGVFLSPVSLAGRRQVTWFKQSQQRSLVQTKTCTVSTSTPSVPRTWMYRKALLRTLRFEVFLSSTLGMLRFNVSKHSFKCARLKKTQVVCQLAGAHTSNQFSRGLELN